MGLRRLHASEGPGGPRRRDALICASIIVALLALSVAERIPLALTRGPLDYDDGVYGASAVAMRFGGLPYRDVFSSQGPMFLPLVRAFDVVGLETTWAPRLLSVAAGTATVITTFLLARLATTIVGAALAGSIVLFSPILLSVTTALGADGVAVAFSVAAVWAAARLSTTSRRGEVLLVGILGGCALGVKGPLVGVPVMAATWLVARRKDLLSALGVATVSALLPVLASVPWGLGNVWDQFIALHLEAAEPIDPVRNVRHLAYRFVMFEPLLLVAFGAGAWMFVRQLRRQDGGFVARCQAIFAPKETDVLLAVVFWLALQSIVLLGYSPLWDQHASHLIVPLALVSGLAIARLKRPWTAFLIVVLVAATWQMARSSPLDPVHPQGQERSVIGDLASIAPPSALVISDEPGLGWWAGRVTPGAFVDTSKVRIWAGSLTLDDLVRGASEDRVCAILVWSGRFSAFPSIVDALAGYKVVRQYGQGRFLMLRPTCQLEDAPIDGTSIPPHTVRLLPPAL